MGCCGGKIKKVGRIALGYGKMLVGTPNAEANKRVEICKSCDWHTWMLAIDYGKYLARHNIRFIRHFAKLEKLPMLPKQEWIERAMFLCRICKCNIYAKSRIKDEKCLKGKW